ncbi:unnamed protein product [Sphenostylis stenocarpa]|uniref:Uncharacterized protein n=1 Tax=Sphenostylis stenocarpa TaxID=92480 RepID=A0AA86SK11_9FABA|nr:unnamed protein product [Sphenostylis stenocarpa]
MGRNVQENQEHIEAIAEYRRAKEEKISLSRLNAIIQYGLRFLNSFLFTLNLLAPQLASYPEVDYARQLLQSWKILIQMYQTSLLSGKGEEGMRRNVQENQEHIEAIAEYRRAKEEKISLSRLNAIVQDGLRFLDSFLFTLDLLAPQLPSYPEVDSARQLLQSWKILIQMYQTSLLNNFCGKGEEGMRRNVQENQEHIEAIAEYRRAKEEKISLSRLNAIVQDGLTFLDPFLFTLDLLAPQLPSYPEVDSARQLLQSWKTLIQMLNAIIQYGLRFLDSFLFTLDLLAPQLPSYPKVDSARQLLQLWKILIQMYQTSLLSGKGEEGMRRNVQENQEHIEAIAEYRRAKEEKISLSRLNAIVQDGLRFLDSFLFTLDLLAPQLPSYPEVDSARQLLQSE